MMLEDYEEHMGSVAAKALDLSNPFNVLTDEQYRRALRATATALLAVVNNPDCDITTDELALEAVVEINLLWDEVME